MDPARWERIAELCDCALGLEPAHRAAFLQQACAGDERLRQDAELLLGREQQVREFLEVPALKLATGASADREREPESERLPAGLEIGPYRVVAFLGGGGMGQVYQARDTRLERDVALKFLLRESSGEPQAPQRFKREARAASALNHPGICTLYDIGEHEGQPYLVMELLEGHSLKERVAAAPLPLAELVRLGLQITEALDTAHARGIVHRDIKPANIFITRSGQAKILDFGLAKLLSEPARALEGASAAGEPRKTGEETTITRMGAAMGTAAYMSPEQARGEEVDCRTDLFSLGVTLYQMATGRLPFLRGAPELTLQAVLQEDPVAPRRFDSRLPSELERIIGRAMEKDRALRYQSAAELKADLARVERGLEAARKRVRRWVLGFAAALALIVALTFGWIWRRQAAAPAAGPGSPALNSVAVLPLVNVSGDPSAEYLGEGIAERVISALSELPGVKVRSYSSVARFRGQKPDAQEVGRLLNVQAVVTGRVLQRGDDLSVSAELVDARDNSQLWGAQYNRKIADLLALQAELGREISDRMRLRLSSEQQNRLARQHTQDVEAYKDYLRGRYYWNKRTGAGLKAAIEHFERAIARDPRFALAHAGLADCYVLLCFYSPVPLRETYPKARAAALKAVEIDATLGEPRTALALVQENFDWDWEGAETDYRRALELSPGYATAHHWYATLLLALGRFDEALAEIKRGLDLDPLDLSINTSLGWILHHSRRYDEAISQLGQTVAMDPNFVFARMHLGLAYLHKGMNRESTTELETALRLAPTDPRVAAHLGYAYAISRRQAEARRILKELLEQSERAYYPAMGIATVYMGLKDSGRTFEWLDRAVAEKGISLTWLNVDPLFDPLRSDPRFQQILRRMNLAR